MINKNLKESTVEELKKRDQQFKFGYLFSLMLAIGGCQKSFFFFFVGMMLVFYCMAQSENIKKELQSRL